MKDSIIKNKTFWIVAAVACLTILPFLGLTDYHTKGEPRESVLSVVMLEKGEWLLPRIIGGEMGYKPPFFQWCIAGLSAVFGGEVTEGTSRLPSALAIIGMSLGVFVFVLRRRGTILAILTALITLSNFELHRAGANCRVDMLLTGCIVGGILIMASNMGRFSWRAFWAILLLSLGTLTKGPIGSVLPCLVIGVFLLLKGEKFWTAFWRMFVIGSLSLILPAFWYFAAYQRAGQEFIDLMMDENVGRMTGTMTYVVHDNPWPINFAYVLSGMLPYSLILLACLVVWFMKRERKTENVPAKENIFRRLFSQFRHWIAGLDDVDLLSWTAVTVVFVFYCIPQSKRSVYLEPLYPFLAYLTARALIWLKEKAPRCLRGFGDFFAGLAFLLLAIFLSLKCGLVPDFIFHGKHAADNIAMLHAIADISGVIPAICIFVTTCLAILWFWRRKEVRSSLPLCVVALVMGIFVSLDGAYQPAVLNTKSIRTIIDEVNRLAPESEGALYEYIEEGRRSIGDPIHMYELNFYIGNRLDNFYTANPESGFLVISQPDAAIALDEYRALGYTFEKRGTLSKKLVKQVTDIYYFKKN